MSAFAGTLHFDRRPIDRAWLTTCGTPANDGHGAWLCWDGRLDNIEELASSLAVPAGRRTDTQILLSAYRRWGLDCLPRIVGDFALVLWDAVLTRLVLARDYVGARTLYFHCDERRVIWSTDLEALLIRGDLPLEVDEEYVAGFLAYEPDTARTPFRNVHAVRPAEAVSWTLDGRCERGQFWSLDLARELRYPREEDYAEAFASLFHDAVRVRLRTDRPVVAELSGGLDSSSIVAVAEAIGSARVETVSQVFDQSATSDERPFILAIERQRGRAGRHFPESRFPLFASIDATSLLPNPYAFASAYHDGVEDYIGELGARVLLSGVGGDEVIGSRQSPGPDLAPLLIGGRIVRLIRRAHEWSDALRLPFVQTLYYHALEPALPASVRRLLRARRASAELSLYRDEYVRHAQLRERLASGLEPIADGTAAARDQAAGVATVTAQVATGFRRQVCSADVTYPFLHRPLVEFLQAIPFDQHVRPGESRVVQRAAMKALLPDMILHRRSKGNPSECFARAFERAGTELARLLCGGHVERRGYVDPAALTRELINLRHGTGRAIVPVLKLAALESWLRALDARGHDQHLHRPPARPVRRQRVHQEHSGAAMPRRRSVTPRAPPPDGGSSRGECQ
jgi:asparagine synthase (glutamine-hydrolysing)